MTTWPNEMNFIMGHTLGVGLIAQLVVQQSGVTNMYYIMKLNESNFANCIIQHAYYNLLNESLLYETRKMNQNYII